jgi:hypothetical protein
MLYLPGLKNVIADFSSHPPSPPEPSGTVNATTAGDPFYFSAMAAEQNHCAETQRLLSSSSLKIVFQQAGAQRLVVDISTSVFCSVVDEKFRKDVVFFFTCTIFHTLGGLLPSI